MKKNRNGSYSAVTPISMTNPEVSKKEDWWDELCKAHNAKNHWKKESKKNENTEEQ